MKLQQLRFVRVVVRAHFNVSAAADARHTAQPGVSNQVQLLEQELGVQIFQRKGKRLIALTKPGQVIFNLAERMLRAQENILRVSVVYSTEASELFPELAMLPCYEWNRGVIVPPGHPLLETRPLTLEAIAEYPIVTYDFSFSGRSKINKAFEAHGLQPNVVLTAIDSDVIKTYVELGLGVGILAKMAYNPERDRNLVMLDAAHLFEPSTTRIGIRRGTYLRSYVYAFFELFAPHLDRRTVEAAMGEGG